MAFPSSWFCSKSTKKMFVKIVHPGGHVELHDRPILAAEILLRNPKCCVAHPSVFQKPWAVVERDTTLAPGQKFYVVPISTVRKLQNLSLRYSPSLVQETHGCDEEGDRQDDGRNSTCWSFTNNMNTGQSTSSFSKQCDHGDGESYASADSCFACLVALNRVKGGDGKGSNEEKRSSSAMGSSETAAGVTRNRAKLVGSPRRRSSFENWQPSLESISEESSRRRVGQLRA